MQTPSLWRVELLGKLRASRHETDVISRFPTQKTAALLAYLSYFSARSHAREELIDMLWPEADLSSGRLRLRVALNALRRRLEPPSVLPTGVLQTDAQFVRVRPGTVTTDVAEFTTLLDLAVKEHAASQKIVHLTQAVALYQGELLPGFYEDWALTAREHLAERFLDALHGLAAAHEAQGELEQANDSAQRVIALDPLREEAHMLRMRVLARRGYSQAARKQYNEMAAALLCVGAAPSTSARALLEKIRSGQFAPAASPVTLTPDPPPPSDPDNTLSAPALAALTLAPPVENNTKIVRLPARMNRFHGRGADIAQLAALLTDTTVRLVTLTGIGGAGKTRLSLELACQVSEAFAIICFVALADLTEAHRVPDVIAQSLGLPRAAETSPLEQVIALLEGRTALLILDNFEQLLPEGADSLSLLLERLPLLTILATSRQTLNLSGEREFPVLPLDSPSVANLSPAESMDFSGIALFVDRAQAAHPAFQITVRNAAAIISLCRRLEGIPLAIELAASWAGTLTPAQMLVRLNRRFELLVSRRRDVPARHQTLRAAIEWSYDRLEPDLRRFYRQLSVFRGGWTLEAAEAVCQEPEAALYLRQLRAYALITSEEAPEAGSEAEEGLRYRMLETLREFAQEQLEEAESAILSEKHARWFLSQLKPGNLSLPEQDNFRAALAWAEAEPAQNELYLQLVGTLCIFWRARGWWREGLAYTEAALTRNRGAYPHLFARIHYGAATLLWLLNDLEATEPHYQQALALYAEAGDRTGMTHILTGKGCVALGKRAFDEAHQDFQEALAIAQQIQDGGMITTLYGNLGWVAIEQKDWPTAQKYMEECLIHSRRLHQSDAWPLQNLADLAQAQEHWPQARALYEESLAEYRRGGETYRIAEVLGSLAPALEHCDEPEAAERCRAESQILSIQLRGA